MGRVFEQPVDIQVFEILNCKLSDAIKIIADRVIAKSDRKYELEDVVKIINSNSDVFRKI
jgi:hypothetical protein